MPTPSAGDRSLRLMPKDQRAGDDEPEAGSSGSGRSKRWYQRPTIRQLKKRAASEERNLLPERDTRENEKSRLPASEAVHFAGLVLAEAFTPSTVSSLYGALERLPTDRPDRRQELLDALAQSRSGRAGGWQNLGVVRRAGPLWVMPDAFLDADLPDAVDSAWLHLSYVAPTVAMLVATFTFTEEAGELSEMMRRDYRTQAFDVRIQVRGRFGKARSRIPWARPARYGTGYSISGPDDQKRRACESLMRRREDDCVRWFAARFPGCFAAAKPQDRPVVRMLLTKENLPYHDRSPSFRPIGLDFAFPLWRSTDLEGWWLAEERPHWSDREHVTTLAARRSDVAELHKANGVDESNASLVHEFGDNGAPLAARQAIVALLSLYTGRLGALRDQAGVKRLFRRPVREARALDTYLIQDGLDAATVTADLEKVTEDLAWFRRDVAEFVEERNPNLPLGGPDSAPLEYVPELRSRIRDEAASLATGIATTTANIRASAELRQAIANTVLQRVVVVLSLVAIVVAVLSLTAPR
jgi:hypothetical protein